MQLKLVLSQSWTKFDEHLCVKKHWTEKVCVDPLETYSFVCMFV